MGDQDFAVVFALFCFYIQEIDAAADAADLEGGLHGDGLRRVMWVASCVAGSLRPAGRRCQAESLLRNRFLAPPSRRLATTSGGSTAGIRDNSRCQRQRQCRRQRARAGRHRSLHLEPHDLAEASLAQLLLDGQEQVVRLVLLALGRLANGAKRLSTYEELEHEGLMVLKRDGRHEEFSREKLLSGVRKACQKRPVTPKAMEDLVDHIVAEVTAKYEAEVPGEVIGTMVSAIGLVGK